MQNRLRQYSRTLRRFDGLLSSSPVITGGLAVPFVVMGTADLRAAVAICFTMLVLNISAVAVVYLLKKAGLGRSIYMTVTALLSAVMIALSARIVQGIHPQIFNFMGIYFSLLAVNTLTFYLATRCDTAKSILSNLLRSVRYSMGFALVTLPIAVFRELVGKGSVYGVKLAGGLQVPSVLLPFFGFIIVGFVCAAIRYANHSIKALLYRAEQKKKAEEQEAVA